MGKIHWWGLVDQSVLTLILTYHSGHWCIEQQKQDQYPLADLAFSSACPHAIRVVGSILIVVLLVLLLLLHALHPTQISSFITIFSSIITFSYHKTYLKGSCIPDIAQQVYFPHLICVCDSPL